MLFSSRNGKKICQKTVLENRFLFRMKKEDRKRCSFRSPTYAVRLHWKNFGAKVKCPHLAWGGTLWVMRVRSPSGLFEFSPFTFFNFLSNFFSFFGEKWLQRWLFGRFYRIWNLFGKILKWILIVLFKLYRMVYNMIGMAGVHWSTSHVSYVKETKYRGAHIFW